MESVEEVGLSARHASAPYPMSSSLQAVVEPRNYLVEECDFCKKEMTIDAGDIVHGKRWYHDSCWKMMVELSSGGR